MSNHQADELFVETLSRTDQERHLLALKPITIKPKQLKKLAKGILIDGFDTYNLRIVRRGEVIARAKLGRIGDREALHIISTDTEAVSGEPSDKEMLLEARLAFLPDDDYEAGDIIEFDEFITTKILILSDSQPAAIGEIVEYDQEGWVYITRVLG